MGTLMQPLQCDLRPSAAKDDSINSIAHAGEATRNLNTATTVRSAEPVVKTQWNYAQRHQKLQLQNRISTPEPKRVDFEAILKRNFKRRIIPAKIERICSQAPFTRLTLPLQCNLRLSAAKRNSNMHAAAAKRNLDEAIPLRSADIALRNTIEWQQTTAEQILLAQQFESTKCLNRCKTQKHSIIKEK